MSVVLLVVSSRLSLRGIAALSPDVATKVLVAATNNGFQSSSRCTSTSGGIEMFMGPAISR